MFWRAARSQLKTFALIWRSARTTRTSVEPSDFLDAVLVCWSSLASNCFSLHPRNDPPVECSIVSEQSIHGLPNPTSGRSDNFIRRWLSPKIYLPSCNGKTRIPAGNAAINGWASFESFTSGKQVCVRILNNIVVLRRGTVRAQGSIGSNYTIVGRSRFPYLKILDTVILRMKTGRAVSPFWVSSFL